MKYLIVVAALAALVALVCSESCTVNTDCATTTCSSGTLVCEHPSSDGVTADGGICTCASTEEPCYTRDDCLSPAHPELNCDDDTRHCYDNSCICSGFPGSIGGGPGGR